MTADDPQTRHWAQDPYWTDALDRYHAARNAGTRIITVDVEAVEAVLFHGDSPAYRLMTAMASVIEHEGYDGHRGAPRLALAFLQLLKELG